MNSQVSYRPSSEKIWRKDIVFLLVLLTASLALNIVLGWKLKHLSYTSHKPAVFAKLGIGDTAPGVVAEDLNDARVIINYADVGKPTVLYIFSPACAWCNRNLENIKTLSRARADSYRFIGLSLSDDRLKEFVTSHQFDFPVYKNVSPESVGQLGIEGTPQTIVVSQEGKVIKNWPGAFGQNLLPEVESFFNVRLPGVSHE